jgi:hypothetical protein
MPSADIERGDYSCGLRWITVATAGGEPRDRFDGLAVSLVAALGVLGDEGDHEPWIALIVATPI